MVLALELELAQLWFFHCTVIVYRNSSAQKIVKLERIRKNEMQHPKQKKDESIFFFFPYFKLLKVLSVLLIISYMAETLKP